MEGAAANALSDPVPVEVKRERLACFMELQAEISAEKLQRKVGRTLTVLVDGIEEGQALARSSADAPEIDGVVYVEHAKDLKAGDFCEVRVTRAGEHDLWAKTLSR